MRVVKGVKGLDCPKASGKPLQEHHFATNKHSKYTPEFEDIAKKHKLDLNDAWNKKFLSQKSRHPHEYHEFVMQNMEKASTEAKGDQSKFLQLFDKYVKQPVTKNPGMLDKDWWR